MSQRAKNEGRIYLRRSTTRQDASMPMQLQWGIAQAAAQGVRLDATQSDLEHMLARGLQQYKGICLDDGISGSDLSRPGFQAFRDSAMSNRQVSHLFIHMSDRFARPELAVQAVQMEIGLLLVGLTIVFSNRTSLPRQLGNTYFAEDVQLLYEYSQNGEFLARLSQRVLESQIRLAQGGYWRGGPAPYGFVRVLVDGCGKEIRELNEGETVKMEGCHVRIKPNDPEKIRIWLLILELHGNHGWGHKRIANYLTYDLNIPSPNAGKPFSTDGETATSSGRWWGETVARLIRNEAILGLSTFGKLASGKHRRFGPEGPRLLEGADRNEKGDAKAVNVPMEQRIVVKTGYDPCADEELFRKCQDLNKERGAGQKGIPRAHDLTKYPLSGRIFDLSPNCGSPLYGRTEGETQKYECSRYRNSGGRECARNIVDNEVALQFVLGVLKQRVIQCGGREKLREKLVNIAASQKTEKVSIQAEEREFLQRRVDQVRHELQTVTGNLALASSQASFQAIETQFQQKKSDLEQLELSLAALPPDVKQADRKSTQEAEVHAAMALFEDLSNISINRDARAEVSKVFKRIELRLGLNFMDNPLGKRPKRMVQGGLLTIGPGQLLFPKKSCTGDQPPNADGGKGDLESSEAGEKSLTSESCQQEGRSFGKDSRGKRSAAPDGTA